METFIKEIPNLIPAEECRAFLDKFLSKEKERSGNDKNFDGEQYEFNNLNNDPDLVSFDQKVGEIVDEEILKYTKSFKHLESKFYQESRLLLKLPKNIPLKLHYDLEISGVDDLGKEDFQRRCFAALFYLQDLPDGHLFFPLQKQLITIQPGKMVIFPTFFTHPHTVFPCSVDRYTYRINYYITDNKHEESGY